MKKLFVSFLIALCSMSLFAQSEDDLSIYRSPNDVFIFDALSHWGYGYHIITTDDFDASGAGEFFLNILKIKIYPTEYLGLEVGADLKFDHFASKTEGFRLNNDKHAVPFDMKGEFGSDIKRARGWMHVNSFSFPALLKVGGEKFKIGAGAEAAIGYRGTANYRYKGTDKRHREKAKGMEVSKFYYDFIGMVSFDGTALYAKYYPKGSGILPDGSDINMSYWTIGIGFDF